MISFFKISPKRLYSTDLILFLKASCQKLLCKRLLGDKITRLFALGEKMNRALAIEFSRVTEAAALAA